MNSEVSERYIQTDRQTDKQTENRFSAWAIFPKCFTGEIRDKNGQTDRPTDIQTNRKIERQNNRQTDIKKTLKSLLS